MAALTALEVFSPRCDAARAALATMPDRCGAKPVPRLQMQKRPVWKDRSRPRDSSGDAGWQVFFPAASAMLGAPAMPGSCQRLGPTQPGEGIVGWGVVT